MTAVMTVTGAVDAGELGVTLMHEHLLNDCSSCWNPPRPGDVEGLEIAEAPVRMEFLGRLHNDPFLSRDNCRLDDVDTAIAAAANRAGTRSSSRRARGSAAIRAGWSGSRRRRG